MGTVTTPEGEVLPIAEVKLQCPYEDCNHRYLFSVAAVDDAVVLPRHISRWLIAHINDDHVPIYDVLGLTPNAK